MITQNKRIIAIVLAVAVILFIPLIAMQFSTSFNWTLFDFIIAGGLLLSTGLACEFVLRRVKEIKYRVALCVALLAILFVIWVELAVGILN